MGFVTLGQCRIEQQEAAAGLGHISHLLAFCPLTKEETIKCGVEVSSDVCFPASDKIPASPTTFYLAVLFELLLRISDG